MAINAYNIKKWYKMLTGKSILHVNQNLGKCYKQDQIAGYYNDLTEKVTRTPELLTSHSLPTIHTEKGEDVFFPVAVFQYGLGAYDLYLMSGEEQYLDAFRMAADWAVAHQEPNGAWNNFFYVYPDHPYGAMAQGEGTSLLVRAYKQWGEDRYIDACHKAIQYMLQPLEEGGTTEYTDDDIILREYTHLPTVMNGFIFAWFGLYDYVLATHSEQHLKILNQSEQTLERLLPRFQNGYWSLYDLSGKIASPFYHNLHIAQMEAMFDLTGKTIYKRLATNWRKMQHNRYCSSRAFIKKAIQKILE